MSITDTTLDTTHQAASTSGYNVDDIDSKVQDWSESSGTKHSDQTSGTRFRSDSDESDYTDTDYDTGFRGRESTGHGGDSSP